MGAILARTVTVPDGPKVDTSGVKAALAPLFSSTAWFWVLLGLVLLGLYLSPRTRRVTKLVALGIMAALVVGWDSDRHVLVAAVGPRNADTTLLVALAIGAAWALLRGPKDRKRSAGSVPDPNAIRQLLGAQTPTRGRRRRGR